MNKNDYNFESRESAERYLTSRVRFILRDVIPNDTWRKQFAGFAQAPEQGVQGWYNLLSRDIHVAYDTIMFENVFLFYYLLVHEFTHLVNHEFMVEDVEKDGYHNELFKKSIKNLFKVDVGMDGSFGFQKFERFQKGEFYNEFARWYDDNKSVWDEIRYVFYTFVKEEPLPPSKTLEEQRDDYEEDQEKAKKPEGANAGTNEDYEDNTPENTTKESKGQKVYDVEEDGGVDLF